jgi:hypothetical protein
MISRDIGVRCSGKMKETEEIIHETFAIVWPSVVLFPSVSTATKSVVVMNNMQDLLRTKRSSSVIMLLYHLLVCFR